MVAHRRSFRNLAIITLSAGLIAISNPLAVAGETADELENATYEAVSAWMRRVYVKSDAGWRASSFKVEQSRYLVVQDVATGDIYQLGNFDGMYVNQLKWLEDDVLQVDWATPAGERWRSSVRLARTDGGPVFEVVDADKTADAPSAVWSRSKMEIIPKPID